LNDHDIDPLLYVGSMNATARNETVKEFYRNENKRVLLISMKAGNVGLTLTCANHVIIMDPFWNPYVEEQAQDRAYRIGQFRPVKIYRILVKDSVEDRIMELQKKKKELIESALDEKGRNHVSGLNREEIGHLFGIRDL
jgi:SNF2 family DNA or RNA helicase